MKNVIIGNDFALAFLQCHFVNFVHHSSAKYMNLFGISYVHLLYYVY